MEKFIIRSINTPDMKDEFLNDLCPLGKQEDRAN